jgi:ribosomal protein S12 methylthiotransferase accessory factor
MPALGPRDPLRASAPNRLLPATRAAAAAAGVTRLADVTRLDPIGFPVWQAVRPMSRALSVHQGKGGTDSEAQLGALLEAAESHAAESFECDDFRCAFSDLPPDARAPDIADFGYDRAVPPDPNAAFRWVEAEDLLGGTPIYLPFDLVSLDLSRDPLGPFDRASNGVATGASRGEAIAAALHELIERDSVREWQETGLFARMACAVDLDSIPFPWFGHWHERIEAAGADLLVYHVRSLTGSPVFACEINDLGKDARPYRAMQGRGCHPLPEIALFKALAEALQGRTTFIAGARDDMLPSDYDRRAGEGILIAFGLPLPPSMTGVDFVEVDPGPIGAAALGEALAVAGYGRIAVVDLAAPPGLHFVRVFVCGLASFTRRRRRQGP